MYTMSTQQVWNEDDSFFFYQLLLMCYSESESEANVYAHRKKNLTFQIVTCFLTGRLQF